jgi:hypothetical protein
MMKSHILIDGAIYRKNENGHQLIIPYELREKLMKEMHENLLQGGHYGWKSIWEKMKT